MHQRRRAKLFRSMISAEANHNVKRTNASMTCGKHKQGSCSTNRDHAAGREPASSQGAATAVAARAACPDPAVFCHLHLMFESDAYITHIFSRQPEHSQNLFTCLHEVNHHRLLLGTHYNILQGSRVALPAGAPACASITCKLSCI